MVKIDIKKFITDRAWFGWWYRDFGIHELPPFPSNLISKDFMLRRYWSTKWVRDPDPKCHWTISKLKWLPRNA